MGTDRRRAGDGRATRVPADRRRLAQVALGIIPAATQDRCHWPIETFHVYDDKLVSVELASAEVNIAQPSEVALYLRAFEQLRSMAVYGADARALVVKAIDALQ